jgi:hypothetical protein
MRIEDVVFPLLLFCLLAARNPLAASPFITEAATTGHAAGIELMYD